MPRRLGPVPRLARMQITRDVLRRSLRAWITDAEDGPGPAGLAWLWTALLSLAVAALFTLFGLRFWWKPGDGVDGAALLRICGINLGISATIAVLIHLEFLAVQTWLGRAWMRSLRGWRRSVLYAALPLLGVAVGWPLGVAWTLGDRGLAILQRISTSGLPAGLTLALLVSLALHVAWGLKARQLDAEKRATEAQLRLLQAQIEPHFLFNTLANVVSLIERDTATAKAMLESFVDYLRASLSGLSRDGHTLADEMRLVEAYLAIARLRMAGRLAVTFDVPPSLLGLRVPALTLQPLVENAIVHGLEPQIAGGRIAVTARRDGDRLVLTVSDDGRGLAPGSAAAMPAPRDPGHTGSGTAIANIRERLARAHPGAASLTLEPVRPHGVEARLSLPIVAEASG